MENNTDYFATLDDSLYFKNSLYVYTHGLTFPDEATKILVIHGDKEEIYDEEKIFNFITKNLTPKIPLYACSHYAKYPKINDLIEGYVFNRDRNSFPDIYRLFDISHSTAKQYAKNKLDELLKR